jgi:hypothetical protein
LQSPGGRSEETRCTGFTGLLARSAMHKCCPLRTMSHQHPNKQEPDRLKF